MLLILLITMIVACSKDQEVDTMGTIEGTWYATSCTNNGGIIQYGIGNYASVGIRFTLNLDGTYSWITDNSNFTSAIPVIIKGTYICTAATNKLKTTGTATAGNYSFNENHLFVIEKLNDSKLIITEETRISGIGIQTYEFSR